MMRHLLLASMLIASPALAQGQANQQQVTLKPGVGLNEVSTSCSVCHTLNYIRMNSPFLTPDAWKAEVTKMRDGYGAPIDDDTAAAIVKYLSDNYAVPPKS
jgi:mono/diheme cytochrome c family protein